MAIEWRPFELHPETPPEGRPRDAASPRGNQVIELAQADGIPMIRTSVIANSRLALEASEFARAVGPEAFDRFHEGVFRAYFVEDRNIGDVEVLAAIAEGVGLDGAALRQALDERRYSEAVDAGIQWSADLGITGTPTSVFVADQLYGLVGAQPYEAFEQVMARLGIEKRA